MKRKKLTAIILSFAMMWSAVSALAEETANNETVKEAVSEGIETAKKITVPSNPLQPEPELIPDAVQENSSWDSIQTTQIPIEQFEQYHGTLEELRAIARDEQEQRQAEKEAAAVQNGQMALAETELTNEEKFRNALLEHYGADQLNPFRSQVSDQTISGNTNKLSIDETDLHLAGKNGMDIDIVRSYSNQRCDNTWSAVKLPMSERAYLQYYLYSFDKINTSSGEEEEVIIGFRTEDEYYLYMKNGCYMGSWNDRWVKMGNRFYDYSTIDYFKSKSPTKIQLIPNGSIVGEIDNVRKDDPGWQVNGTKYFTHYNTIGNGWYLNFPKTDMVLQGIEDLSPTPAPSSTPSTGTLPSGIERTFQGSFQDIHNNIRSFTGNQYTYKKGNYVEITRKIRTDNNDNIKYTYFDVDQVKDGITYNFTAADKDGLTYYMYCDSWWRGSKNRAVVLMIQDDYENTIRYEYDEGRNDVVKIIDTYGREIHISTTGIRYFDPDINETKTVAYAVSTLPSADLNNGSKWDFRDVLRLSVTNANGETTHYDARKADGIATFQSQPVQTLERDDILQIICGEFSVFNIERIIYPTGYEKRYLYDNIYMYNTDTRIKKNLCAVIQSEDRINGEIANQKTYTLEKTNKLGDMKITGLRTEDNQKTVQTFDAIGRLAMREVFENHSDMESSYSSVEYEYGMDEWFVPRNIKTESNGVKTEEKYAYRGENLLLWSSVNDKKIEMEYHQIPETDPILYRNIPKRTIYYRLENQQYIEDYRIETTLVDGHAKIADQTVIQDGAVKGKTAYAYDSFGEISQVKIWTEDSNGDGVLNDNDSYMTADSTTQFTPEGTMQVTNTAAGLTDADGNSVPAIQQQYQYNIYGSPTQQTDGNNNVTAIEYDTLNRPIKYTLPNGAVQTVEYNLAQLYTIVTDEKGVKTKYLYDAMGRNVRQQTEHGGVWKDIAAITYDSLGRISSQTAYTSENQGVRTVNTYDNLDRVIKAEVYSLTGAKLYTENYAYQYKDPNMQTVIKTTVAADASVTAVQKTTTNNVGKVMSEEVSDGAHTYTTSYTYDYMDRPVTETDAKGFTTTYTYDYAGNVTAVDGKGSLASSAYDMAGRKISDTDKKGNIIRYEYDGLGRVIRQISPFDETSDSVTKTYYDANSNVVKQMVQNNQPGEAETFRTTQYRYDSMNNVIASIGENGETDQVVQYQYDNRNLMTGMITGLTAYSENTVEGALTQYAYDSYGRLQKTTDPMGMETNYSYDYLGNQTGAADRNGNQTTMQYGVFGMTRMTVTGEGKSERTENSYNNLGQATEKKLYENNALTDQASYTYDAFGRVTKETENGRTKEYAYDENSNVISFQLKQGSMVKNEVTYDYNSYDWLVSLISGGTEVSYAYDVNGNLKLRAMGTYRTWYDYNKANLPVRMENEDVFKDAYQEYHYTYGLDGNKLTDTQTGGIAKAYTYDGLGRLANETVTNGEHTDRMSYVYDAFGNRQSMTVEGSENYTANYRYDLNNRLLSATKNMGDNKQEITNYRYDNNGNELFRHTMTYTDTGTYDINVNHEGNGFTVSEYNLMGQVTRVNSDKAEAKYSYNVSGLRKSKTVNNETTNFIWNGQNMVAEAGDSDIIQNTYTYDAFGNEIGKDANDMNPFRYCGEYYDSETENIYLRARYYNPADGRFVSEDPIKDGLNWYIYCYNDSINFVDSSGLIPTPEEAAAMAEHIYGDYDMGPNGKKSRTVNGWRLIEVRTGRESMKMGIYIREDDDWQNPSEYVLVFKGTDEWIGNEGKNNIEAYLSSKSADVWDAMNYGLDFVNSHSDREITFVGHSKGGGEAIAAADYTNKNAITFNAANYKFEKYVSGKGSGTINNYYVDGDILSATIGVAAIGNVHWLPKQYAPSFDWYDSVATRAKKAWKAGLANHDIATVRQALYRRAHWV